MTAIVSLKGLVFGHLTVLNLHPERTSQGKAKWLCRCICGTEVIVVGSNLQREHGTRSCGCKGNIKDITGHTFGHLKVVSLHPERTANGHKQWVCLCHCGKTTLVTSGHLERPGGTRSCGCMQHRPRPWIHKKFRDNPQTPNFNHLFKTIKYEAKRKGLVFMLTPQQARILLESNCHYCGRKPEQAATQSNKQYPFMYNGLDRKDNNRGYTPDNVVPCCWPHNQMKGTLPYEEFIDLATDIVRHLYLQNKNKR